MPDLFPTPTPTPSPSPLTSIHPLIYAPSYTDVPSWLKSLRLHKYAALFSQMSYEEMMTLTEQHLESQVNLRDHWVGVGPAPLGACCSCYQASSVPGLCWDTPVYLTFIQLPVSFYHRMSPKVPGTK